MNWRHLVAASALVFPLFNTTAYAAMIMFQPVVVDANAGVLTVNNIWSQIGLSEKYTHGVTVFDDYIAANPTHSLSDSWELTSGGDGATATMSVDRGNIVTLSKMVLWNAGGDIPHNIRTFDLYGSLSGDFSSDAFVILSDQLANPNLGQILAVSPEVFTFTPADVRYVRLMVTDTYFPTRPESLIVRELAFVGVVPAVPEPSSLAISSVLFGLLCVGRLRNMSSRVTS